MSERKINLEKLIFDYKLIEKSDDKGVLFHLIRYAMKEACHLTLELAAENATADLFETDDSLGEIIVNKQSILNTIKQVK